MKEQKENELKGIEHIKKFVKANMGDDTKGMKGSFNLYGDIDKDGNIKLESGSINFSKRFETQNRDGVETCFPSASPMPVVIVKGDRATKVKKALKERSKK